MAQHNFFGGDFFGGDFFFGVHPSGGGVSGNIPDTLRVRQGRTRSEIAKERRKYGIHDDYAEIIHEVAVSQVARLEVDEQKRFEELHRELELRKIAWQGRYLEVLNQLREQMINAEIADRIRLAMRRDEEDMMALVLLAASL